MAGEDAVSAVEKGVLPPPAPSVALAEAEEGAKRWWLGARRRKAKQAKQGGDGDGAKKEPDLPKPSYLKLYSYADRTDKLLIAVGSVCALGNGSILPLFTVIFGELLDTIGSGSTGGLPSAATFQSDINTVCLHLLYLAIAAGFASYFSVAFWMLAGTRQARRLKEAYLSAALRQDVAYYDTAATSGELSNGINEDTVKVQNAIGEKVGNCLQNLGTFVAGMIVAFVKGWAMTLVTMSLIPLIAGVAFVFATLIGKQEKRIASAYADANALAQESLGNMRTVAAFGAQQRTAERYSADLGKAQRQQITAGVFQGGILGVLQSSFMFSYALSLWFGSTRVLAGQYNGGEVLTVLFAALIGGFALGMAAPNVQYFVQGQAAYARLQKVLDRKPAIDEETGGDTLPSVQGAVELREVTFCYPARPEVTVLDSLSLAVPPGSSFALCGASGSGKSTVVQLVERFYDPQQGSVLLDGRDIRSLDLRWYRSHVGLVSQEPTLFASDIYSNIAYGRPGATPKEIEAAAETANAHAFISRLPLGYRTPVGDKGVQLSGGQKQRIAIARAILKNPKVLLCDEATSALDNRSERLVQLALERLSAGRTTLVVAHRLSTIVHSDQIAVVREGRIVEQGTHAQLIAREGGAYATLVGLQMSALGVQPRGEAAPRRAAEEEDEDEELARRASGSQKKLQGSFRREPSASLAVKEGFETPEQQQAPGWRRALARARRLLGRRPAAEEGGEEAAPKEEQANAGFLRLARFNAPEWHYFLIGCAASAVLGLIMPGFALAISTITSAFYQPPPELKRRIAIWCGVFAALGAAGLASGVLQGFCFTLMGARLTRRVRVLLIRALMRQDMGFFDRAENSSGSLVARLGVDTAAIRGAVGDQASLLVQQLVTLVASYAIAFASGWKMTLVITAVMPLLLFAGYMELKFMSGWSSDASKLYDRANQAASDAFGSCRTVAAFNLRSEMHALYRGLLDAPERASNKRAQVSGLGYSFSQFTMLAVYALGFWYGGSLVVKGELSFEQMMRVFFAIVLAAMGISQARMAFPDVSKAAGAVQRVFCVLDRKSPIDASDPGGERLEAVQGLLELQAVSFAYPERPEVRVFEAFSLRAEPRRTLALCGQSGSGKSSIVALVLRFYDPLAGKVMLDGTDIRRLNLGWLRQQMALVSQEPHLFTGTIQDNIRYGCPEASEEQVREAAAAANALDFIQATPAGMLTPVGEGGIQLSGGQRQRIAIARSIIRQPRILLLDEATSALDAASERIVQEALDQVRQGRTTVVVAHRLSTIRNADSIAVLQDGRILEQGSHEQLMARPRGAYLALVNQQRQAV